MGLEQVDPRTSLLTLTSSRDVESAMSQEQMPLSGSMLVVGQHQVFPSRKLHTEYNKTHTMSFTSSYKVGRVIDN